MGSLSLEIKARCPDPSRIRKILLARGASFEGLDRQIDTYFRVPSGRFKLREGNIENALIYYKRADRKRSKECDATIFPCKKKPLLKKLLTVALGTLTVVDKKREIYFIRNAKFHIDRVKHLGNFVEIEVFGRKGSSGVARLREQCEFYQKLLGIRVRELVRDSYSDQLLRLETTDRRLKIKTKM
jgi:predicted adenylyl cyclase CyaB